jgi:ABC-type maltose transport system permease subunit
LAQKALILAQNLNAEYRLVYKNGHQLERQLLLRQAASVLIVSDKLRTLPAGIGMLITQAQAVMPHSFQYPILKISKAEAALAGLIALFPVLVVFMVAQRLIVRGGATVGSVKG